MAITREDVLHVARLSRLELTEVEVDRMARDLGRILAYMDELSGVDTTGVDPTTTIAVESAPLRGDSERPGLDAGKRAA